MKETVRNTIILTVITLISGLLLGVVYQLTKEPIARGQEETRQEAFRTVMPEGNEFEELEVEEDYSFNDGQEEVSGAVLARDSGGQDIGYCINVTTHEGYGGDIDICVGILPDGSIKGVEILSISETAGLGMRANTPEFKAQFVQKGPEAIAYSKTGASLDNEIDALSGATITSNAMTNAVNAALDYWQEVIGK